MKKAVVTRNYSFADATLITICNNTHHFITRDIAEFAAFNVLPADMTAFRNEVTAFEDLPTDQELLGAQIEATEKKDLIAENLKVAIREIMTRAQSKYGVHGARYKKFGTEGMDVMDDPHLLVCGRRVKRIATEFTAELATKGLTAAMITALNNLNQDFEDALDKKSDAIATRDVATEDRIEMGNTLYKKLADYADLGKTIWITRDEAKYNDYVLYDTPTGLPPATPPTPAP